MEIRGAGCGEVALARAEPVYENFRQVGEEYICTSCGKLYASAAETPFVSGPEKPKVFSDADWAKDAAPPVFEGADRQHCCGWCRHLILSSFGQRCGVLNRFTDATDVCGRFEKKVDKLDGIV